MRFRRSMRTRSSTFRAWGCAPCTKKSARVAARADRRSFDQASDRSIGSGPATPAPPRYRRLRENLHEADAARGVPGKEDAVGIGRVDIKSARVAFRLRQRKLNPLLGLGIEAGDLVDLMLADPDVVVLLVHDHRVI